MEIGNMDLGGFRDLDVQAIRKRLEAMAGERGIVLDTQRKRLADAVVTPTLETRAKVGRMAGWAPVTVCRPVKRPSIWKGSKLAIPPQELGEIRRNARRAKDIVKAVAVAWTELDGIRWTPAMVESMGRTYFGR